MCANVVFKNDDRSTFTGPWQSGRRSWVRTYLIGRELFLQTHVICRRLSCESLTNTERCASASRSKLKPSPSSSTRPCLCLRLPFIRHDQFHKCGFPKCSWPSGSPFLPISLELPAYLKRYTEFALSFFDKLTHYTVKQLWERVPEWSCNTSPNCD